jgi:hypothetical protein
MIKTPNNPYDHQGIRLSTSLTLRYLAQHPDNYIYCYILNRNSYFPWIVENKEDGKLIIKFRHAGKALEEFLKFICTDGAVEGTSGEIFKRFVRHIA